MRFVAENPELAELAKIAVELRRAYEQGRSGRSPLVPGADTPQLMSSSAIGLARWQGGALGAILGSVLCCILFAALGPFKRGSTEEQEIAANLAQMRQEVKDLRQKVNDLPTVLGSTRVVRLEERELKKIRDSIPSRIDTHISAADLKRLRDEVKAAAEEVVTKRPIMATLSPTASVMCRNSSRECQSRKRSRMAFKKRWNPGNRL